MSFVFTNIMSTFRESVVVRSITVLNRRDKFKLIAIVLFQITFGILDLLGIALVGVLGALAVNGVESRRPGSSVSQVLNRLHLQNMSFQNQAMVLGILATALLISRTITSIFFTRRTLFFLSRRGAKISATLIGRLLSQPLLKIQSRTTQQTSYAITEGVTRITLGVVANLVNIVTDSSLLILMSALLFVIDPVIALSTFLLFSSLGLVIYFLVHKRATRLGSQTTVAGIESKEKIFEVLQSYRESVVAHRRGYYVHQIGKRRTELADVEAEQSFLPFIGKYVIESSVLIGALIISAIQFIFFDASHAVATLSIFLAAGTRIAPTVLRIQQSAVTINSSIGQAEPTLDLLSELGNVDFQYESDFRPIFEHSGFIPSVEVGALSFRYPSKDLDAVKNISLRIEPGEFVAIVGPSGAGKTTLVDLILGVLSPDAGSVLISGAAPGVATSKFHGAIAYVPQDIIVFNGTIANNVAMGYEFLPQDLEQIMAALKRAQLEDLISELPSGINSAVGERGSKLSGGQRQRLGIARALYTNPKLIILDEATSALDGETEAKISASLSALRGTSTVIVIAHRLATIKNADKVVYMNAGMVEGVGNFEEVRSIVPDFDNQSRLMGL